MREAMVIMAAASVRQAVAAEAQARANASLADGIWALVQGQGQGQRYACYETFMPYMC